MAKLVSASEEDRSFGRYFGGGEVLSHNQLKRLKEHKYSAAGQSLLEPPLQVFWRWLVEQVPLWWAPNAITIVGLAINIVATLILVFYSPDCIQEPPRWAFFINGVALFLYQTLDAIDGKQARRTKSSSPLGELFDHGCDSISTVVVIIGTSIALKLGTNTGWLLFENLSANLLFYLAHWQAYVCGTLQFGKIDVTEGQFSVMGIHFITAILGTDIWSYQVPVLSIELKFIPIIFSVVGAIVQVSKAFHAIFFEGGVGKNGSTVAGTSIVFPSLPIAMLLVIATVIQQKSPSMVFANHPCLYLLAFGLLSAKVTNRLVVAHMTKSEMDLWDTGLLGPLALFLNQYFDCVLNEYFVLWFCMIWVLFDILRYSTVVCQEICDYLQIYCFTITSKPSGRKNKTSSCSD